MFRVVFGCVLSNFWESFESSQNGQKWSKMVKNCQKWTKSLKWSEQSKMVNIIKKYKMSTMVKNDQKWSKSSEMVKLVKIVKMVNNGPCH